MPLRPGESREFKLGPDLSQLVQPGEEPPREPFALGPVVADVSIERNPQAP